MSRPLTARYCRSCETRLAALNHERSSDQFILEVKGQAAVL